MKLVYDDPAVKAGGPVTSSPYYFDREYSIILTEIDSRAHFQDAHILETDWTDFRANFWLMNGRAYPDTLEPNAPFDTAVGPTRASRLVRPTGHSGRRSPLATEAATTPAPPFLT